MIDRRAVFIDRDGTLIRTYPGRPANNPEEVELLQGVSTGLRRLKDAGFMLIVVTNQGGVGLGYMTMDTLSKMHDQLDFLIKEAGGPFIDAYYFCPHTLQAKCLCRKPHPKMILDAAKEFGIDPSKSYMVGDDPRDIQAGAAAKLRKGYMVKSDRTEETPLSSGTFDHFGCAAEAILNDCLT
jgi:D-glycero-D-manno-heptose 1,7-bisphosphate phosphatase